MDRVVARFAEWAGHGLGAGSVVDRPAAEVVAARLQARRQRGPVRNRVAERPAAGLAGGRVGGGEGVMGLARAFHLAGARNVVASLWKVDDTATVALMKLFYQKLWNENKRPIVALREAQLALYRHPDQIDELASLRGPDFSKTVRLVDGGSKAPKPTTAATKFWAPFVLSGGIDP